MTNGLLVEEPSQQRDAPLDISPVGWTEPIIANIEPSPLLIEAHEEDEIVQRLTETLSHLQQLSENPTKDYDQHSLFEESLFVWQNDVQILQKRFPQANVAALKEGNQQLEKVREQVSSAKVKRALVQVGVVFVGTQLAIAALPTAVGVIGFGVNGVRASSVASKVQSVVYGANTCGVFSKLQSFGATGRMAASTYLVAQGCGSAGIIATTRPAWSHGRYDHVYLGQSLFSWEQVV